MSTSTSIYLHSLARSPLKGTWDFPSCSLCSGAPEPPPYGIWGQKRALLGYILEVFRALRGGLLVGALTFLRDLNHGPQLLKVALRLFYNDSELGAHTWTVLDLPTASKTIGSTLD